MKRYFFLSALFFSLTLWAQGPSETGTYYQAADGKKGAELKSAFFAIISPHEVQAYTPDVWEAINSYDLHDDGTVWDIYSGISHFTPVTDQDKGLEIDEEGIVYNREHAMPKSWFNEAKQDNYTTAVYPMYTDLHHLFPTDRSVNSFRSNYPYGEVGTQVTKQSEGGFSKFGRCADDLGYKVSGQNGRVFEPNDQYKGDLARAYFYMATCYESYVNEKGVTRSPADWKSDMLESNVYPFFTPWALTMLLRWSEQDPVSVKEIVRNEAIYGIQKNRNPFIDYPGLEQYIWGSRVDVAFSYDHYVPVETAIRTLQMQSAQQRDNYYYNMQGQRVSPTQLRPGIYIHQGRKIIIRH